MNDSEISFYEAGNKIKLKYQIADDLRLNVWFGDRPFESEPDYFLGQNLDGTPWSSKEEVEQFVKIRFSSERYEIV